LAVRKQTKESRHKQSKYVYDITLHLCAEWLFFFSHSFAYNDCWLWIVFAHL